MTVTATPQLLYESQSADSLLRTQKNIADVPRIIDVLPEQIIIDQQVHKLDDVVRLSPNVVSSDGYGGTADDFIIRGFRRANTRYRNGVRIDGTSGLVNLVNVDSVQIIKGPVADIGQMPPGGLVNIETKSRFSSTSGPFPLPSINMASESTTLILRVLSEKARTLRIV